MSKKKAKGKGGKKTAATKASLQDIDLKTGRGTGGTEELPDKEGAPTPETPATTKGTKKEEARKIDPEPLRKPLDEAKARLDQARAEAKDLEEKARALILEAKGAYLKALVPYRDACRKAKVPCEYTGGRSTNVSEAVRFVVEKVEKGIRVMVRGKPETEEVLSFAALKESVNKQAYSYVEEHIGPREEVGNKGGSLSNRLRAVLKA